MKTSNAAFKTDLARKVEEAEHQAEQAFTTWGSTNVHPHSTEYKMLKDHAILLGGRWTGLLEAWELLTGEFDERRQATKIQDWLARSPQHEQLAF